VTARDVVLSRIRAAIAGAPVQEVPRDYATTTTERDVVSVFAERVADYHARVVRRPAGDVAEVIRAELGGRRVAVPAELPRHWYDGASAVVDDGLPIEELDRLDGALTGCRLAIAETGTIVLDGGSLSGRRALSLVPDYHLCVVAAAQVVGTVPEAVAALAPPAGPLTFVSGPSATSDIELSRVEGVHGPRTLVVLIAE
jgi:L-lactate dehydrogenase complex protein LldG